MYSGYDYPCIYTNLVCVYFLILPSLLHPLITLFFYTYNKAINDSSESIVIHYYTPGDIL